MLSFPLVSNELLRQGRRPGTYAARLGLIGLVFLPLSILWGMGHAFGMDANLLDAAGLGMGLGVGAFTIQFIAVVGITPILASSTLTQEKDERTLGLLMMADLHGWDIILSKFTSVMLRVGVLILGSLPFFGFASLLGGVDLANCFVATLSFYICAGGICAIGIFFSTTLRLSSLAVTLTVLCTIIYCASVAAIDVTLLSTRIRFTPIYAIGSAFSFGTVLDVVDVFFFALPSLVPILVLGVVFLLGAIVRLPGQVFEDVARPTFMKSGARRSSLQFWRKDPVARLVGACVGGISLVGRARLLRVLVLFAVAIVVSLPVVGWLFIMIVLFREIILSMERLRDHGILDDLVLVPHSDGELGRAFWWGHVGAAKFYAVLLVLSFVPAHFYWGFDVPILAAFLPVVIAHFSLAIAVACFSGTFGTRLGSVGAYVFVSVVYLGYFVPPAVVAWWKRETMSLSEVWVHTLEREYGILYEHLGRHELIIVFAITNAVLPLLIVATCWGLGRRLRHRPIFSGGVS